jgi:hypothetical protein
MNTQLIHKSVAAPMNTPLARARSTFPTRPWTPQTLLLPSTSQMQSRPLTIRMIHITARHVLLTILAVLFLFQLRLNIRIVGNDSNAAAVAASASAIDFHHAPKEALLQSHSRSSSNSRNQGELKAVPIVDEQKPVVVDTPRVPRKPPRRRRIPRRQKRSSTTTTTTTTTTTNLQQLTSPLFDATAITSIDKNLFEGLSDSSPPTYLYSDQQVQDYAASFSSASLSTRSLSFLHIPKTGGSTIENTNPQIPWGKCLFIGRTLPPGITLNACPWQFHPHPLQLMYFDIPDWHLPAHFFPFAKANPYYASELFAVIRMPPLDRAISQYFWFCAELRRANDRMTLRKYCSRTRNREASVQKYFQDRLHPTTLRTYLMDHAHWIPQYDYIVGPLQVRYVNHVLQLQDNIQQDYSALGRAYQLNLTWPDTRANAQAHNKKLPSVSQTLQVQLEDHFQSDWLLVNSSIQRTNGSSLMHSK